MSVREDASLFENVKFLKFIRLTVFLSAAVYLIIYLWLAYQRLQYPFELEWVEGGMVDEVQRIVNGQGIYVAPSINYVPFLYPPLYFYVSAWVAKIFGGGFFSLRLVSIISSFVSFSAIFMIVYRESKDWLAAFLSVGLFAASFRLTGAWLDVGRVDSLFLAIWLVFVYFVKGEQNFKYAALSGLLAVLAFLTKQTALIICLPVIAYLFWRNWKYAFTLSLVAALTAGIITLILNQFSAGWYAYYIFGLLPPEWPSSAFITFITSWNVDFLVHLPLAILFVIFFFMIQLGANRPAFFMWLSIFAGAFAGSYLSRVKTGGYDNVLLPAYAVISILFGLGLNELLKTVNRLYADHKNQIEAFLYTACLIQLIILFYNPFTQIPTRSDIDAGYELIQLISKTDGEVYLPDHGYLTTLAGRKAYAHQGAIWEVLRGDPQSKGTALLIEDLNRAIRGQKFDMIIIDSVDWNYCCAEIQEYYTRQGEMFKDNSFFYPVTGWVKRPTYIYIANRLK